MAKIPAVTIDWFCPDCKTLNETSLDCRFPGERTVHLASGIVFSGEKCKGCGKCFYVTVSAVLEEQTYTPPGG